MQNNINSAENNAQNSVYPAYIYQTVNPYIKPKKMFNPMSKKDILFMILFTLASFLFVDFALFKGFNLGFTITYFIIFALTSAYISKKDRIPVFSIICGVLSLAGSITFALYNDKLVNFIMFILIVGLFAIYCLGISASFKYKQGSFKILIDMLLSVFVYPFKNLPDVFGSLKSTAKNNKRSLNGLIGVLVAIPVLVVVIPLLVKSDAAFEGLVTAVISNIGIYLLELAFAIIITPYIFSFMFGKKEGLNKKQGLPSKLTKKLPSSACVSFLSVISITYVVYLFSQLAYFFSAFKGILPENYEYSASVFARRGFFEMFAICVINIAIISGVSMLTKKKLMSVKLLSLFISLFSVLLLITAMQKMKLNISIFGMSKNRLLVSVFMVMLLIIIAFFIIHIFAPKISYMQPIIVVCSIMFIALSFANVDNVVAKYNVNAYNSEKIDVIDVNNLAELSDTAVEYVIELAESDDSTVSAKAKKALDEKIERDYYDVLEFKGNELVYCGTNDFRWYCYTKEKACKMILDYYNS